MDRNDLAWTAFRASLMSPLLTGQIPFGERGAYLQKLAGEGFVTIEENTTVGGFGSAILEWMAKNELQTDTLVLGLPDAPIPHGTQKQQRAQYALDGPGIASRILERLKTVDIPERIPIPEVSLSVQNLQPIPLTRH